MNMLEFGATQADEQIVYGDQFTFATPATYREYFVPITPAALFIQGYATATDAFGFFPLLEYRNDVFDRPGPVGSQAWNDQPEAPGATTVSSAELQAYPGYGDFCAACRQGNTFYPLMYRLSPDGMAGATYPGLVPSSVQLSQGGTQLPQTMVGNVPTYQLPPGPAQYMLTLDDSPHSTTQWTFNSGQPTADNTPAGHICLGSYLTGDPSPCQPAPLIFLSYQAGLSLANAVTGPGTRQLTITAYQQDPAASPVTSLKLWTSTDHGTTWQQAQVTSDGHGSYTASYAVPDPTTGGSTVSIKAQAIDASGDAVSQTLIDAYTITPAQ